MNPKLDAFLYDFLGDYEFDLSADFMNDYGFTTVDMWTFCHAAELEFDIELHDLERQNIRTIQEFINLVNTKLV